MPSSYSDLQTYRNCPRLSGFQKLGYRSPSINEPMTTGQLVHLYLASYFRNGNTKESIEEMVEAKEREIARYLAGAERYEAEQALDKAFQRASMLFNRYTLHWAKDYKATLVEPRLELDGVVCHPDLIAYYKDQRVIVDFKTSYHPDSRWYDMSGQADLYTYILHQKESWEDLLNYKPVDLIIYDIISEEGLFRHQRPPRLNAGRHLFEKVQELSKLPDTKPNWYLVGNPHSDYTCPSRCDYFGACWMLETDTWESCKDYLEENFITEEK